MISFTEVQTGKIARALLVLLFVASLYLALKAVNESKTYRFIGKAPSEQASISVIGEGEVFAIPDIATFTFSVSATNKEVQISQAEVTKKINAALAFLRENGIEDKDIKTASYDIYPKYEYAEIFCVRAPCLPPKQELTGYEVTHSIMVKVRETDKAGTLLGGLGDVGVTNASGLAFFLDDKETKEGEARAFAIEDAKAKAKQLAKDLGVRLGSIRNFSESINMPYYGKMEVFASADGGGRAVPEIPAGETKITSHVTITYEIR